MANMRLGYIGKSFAFGALGIIGTLVACGGGGTTNVVAQTATASPYVLFASSYTPVTPSVGDHKWNTAEGGKVYMGSGGNYAYAGWGTWAQSDIDYHQSVGIQFDHSAALAPTDYVYTKIQAPQDASLNVSQSGKLIIQMGNGSTQANTPTVFTVRISGGTYNTTNFTYANTCTVNVTLAASNTANNLRTYSLPLATFGSCTGTLAALKADLKAVVVEVVGSNDANASSTTNNLVLPKVGFVAFAQ